MPLRGYDPFFPEFCPAAAERQKPSDAVFDAPGCCRNAPARSGPDPLEFYPGRFLEKPFSQTLDPGSVDHSDDHSDLSVYSVEVHFSYLGDGAEYRRDTGRRDERPDGKGQNDNRVVLPASDSAHDFCSVFSAAYSFYSIDHRIVQSVPFQGRNHIYGDSCYAEGLVRVL